MRRPTRPPGPLVLREARAELPVLVCLALLTALLTALAAAGPGLLDRLAGHALASRLGQEQRARPGLTFSATFEPADERLPGARDADLGEDLRPATAVIGNAVPEPLDGSLAPYATRVVLPPVTTRAGGRDVGLGLVYASDAPGPAAYTEGRPPDPDSGTAEVAFSTGTREALGLRLGQRLPLRPGTLEDIAATAVVVGFFTTDAPAASAGTDTTGAPAASAGTAPGDTGRLWREEPLLSRPAPHREGGAAGLDLEARALVAPRTVTTLQKQAEVTLTVTWHLRLDLDAPAAARFAGERGRAELARLLSAYPDDARMAHCGERAAYGGMYCPVGPHPGSALEDTTRLSGVLTAFGTRWNQARTIISFGLASLLVVGLLTVVVTASLAVRRGLRTLRLRRARGASPTGLALAAAGRTAPAVLLGLVAGTAAARAVAGTAPAYGYGLLVALLVWLVLPALTRYALRDRTTSPGHRTTAGPARRRLVAEAALLLLAAAGVLALRVRGTASGPDPLLAAVPALLGLVTVAVLVRCLPPPLRLLARWAVRRRGAVALLAPARAARDAPARALALLVLVVTLAGAVFGQLVTGTLADGRREAAAWRAGADAAFLGAARHPGIAGQLARTDGVRGTVHVRQLRVDATTSADGDRYGVASLLAVDAARLRALAPGSRTARALDAARVTGPARGGETPVLATDGRVGDVLTHTLHGQRRRLRIVGTLPETVLHDPALGPLRGSTTSRDRLLLTDNRALGDIAPDDFEQTALLLYGPRLDVAALRALVPRAGAHAATGELRVRAEEEAEAAADGTVRVLVAAHTATTALTALLALLALVLDLTLSAPERTRTTAYLRTLGMPARSASALHVLQLLPLVLAAVAGGTALGLALPELLGPALSLRDVTGGPAAPAAGPDPVSVAALGGGLTLLVAVAAGLETFRARRRGAGAVLRLTEER